MKNDDISNTRDLAYELWKVHQSVIARKENLAYSMRNWLFTLITATIISTLSKSIQVDSKSIVIFSSITIILFYVMEVCNRVPSILSQQCVEKIILFLRYKEKSFPSSLQYGKKELLKEHISVALKSNVWVPYLVLELIIISHSVAL